MIEYQHDDEPVSTLLELMDAISDVAEPRALAERALERLIERRIITAGGVWLRTGGELVCLAQRNLVQALPRSAILGAIETGEAVYSTSQGLRATAPAPSLAILPLKIAGATIGALAILTPAPPRPEQRLVLQALASHLGLAIEHARLCRRDQGWATDREWEEFLSHAAHEIKNPLASIKGYADLMLRRAARDSADPNRKGLITIAQQVARTTALLDQLSDISRVGDDRLQINRRDRNLTAIVGDAVQEYEHATEQHQLTFDGAAPLRGRFDEPRMRQVVGAMLSNAIKFSPNGGRIVVLLRRSAEDDGRTAVLSVSDTGVGVPPGEQERVFERFFRGSNIRGSFSGMGVGLYIAQAIVGQHGGRMWLESKRGLGTTCFAALPLT